MKQWQKEKQRLGKKYQTTTHYILSSIIPYTEANLKLAFKPSLFFNDLEKLDQIKATRKSLQSSYYKAVQKDLIIIDSTGIPRLTPKGLKRVRPFSAKRLMNSKLMVIFDIPESERHKRDHLRRLLKELSFEQIQKSVWMSENDHREYLKAEINEYELEDFVQIFESMRIKI